jgi:predicted PurR-regulated permease PerM
VTPLPPVTGDQRTFWQSARRFATTWGFAAFLVLVIILFRRVVLPFLLGVMLAYVLAPAVDRLSRIAIGRRRVPRFAAVLILYVGIVGALAIFFGAFLPRLSGDFSRLFREAPVFFGKVKTNYAPRASSWLEENFPSDAAPRDEGPRDARKLDVTEVQKGHYEVSLENLEIEVAPAGRGRFIIGPPKEGSDGRLADFVNNLARSMESETMDLLKLGQRFVAGVVKAIASLILMLMVAAFLLVDLDRILAFLRTLPPERLRGSYDELVAQIDKGLAGVVRGQLVICVVNGALTYLGLLILHVKYPLLLGMLAMAMSLIPVFGSILSSVPIVLVALIAGANGIDLERGAATLAWIIGIHLFEANFLNPKIIGSSAKIHPVVVIFALLVGEDVGGLVGALVAVPVASIVQTLFLFLRRRSRDQGGEVAAAGVPPVPPAGEAQG